MKEVYEAVRCMVEHDAIVTMRGWFDEGLITMSEFSDLIMEMNRDYESIPC